MTLHQNQARAAAILSSLGELIRQEFWIVLKAYFAPVFGTIAVISHLREVIRLTDR